MISLCRVLLALFALYAVYADPEIASSASAARSATFLVAYSLILMGLMWWRQVGTLRMRIFIHIADVALYTLLVDLTRGSASPFFVFFMFALFCAMLRFGTDGVIVTGAAGSAAYIGLALLHDTIRTDSGYLALRLISMLVMTAVISYICAYEERTTLDLRQLATWPTVALPDREAVIRDALERVLALVNATSGAIAWEEKEEPWVYFASLDRGKFNLAQEGPQIGEGLTAPELAESAFLMRHGEHDRALVDRASEDEAEPIARIWRGNAVGSEINARFAPHALISAHFGGEFVHGRVFAFNGDFSIDDLGLIRVAGRLILARLEQLQFLDQMRIAAVADERIRVARDLHDWLLQSLTAAALQIEVARRSLSPGNADAKVRLRQIEELIESDQAELRTFIMNLRPTGSDYPQEPPLREQLHSLAARFERQWGLAIEVEIAPPQPHMTPRTASEVYNIVSEAVANAAKHAHARRIRVRVTVTPDDILISVTDDGIGFPFHGTFTLDELNEQNRGPVMLKERVAALDAELLLHSSSAGSSLDVRVPRV